MFCCFTLVMSPAGCEAREHVKVDQDVVHELGAEDEEAHPGAVLDADDADRGEPAPRPPERCLGDGGVGVPALVGPVLRVPGSWAHDVISVIVTTWHLSSTMSQHSPSLVPTKAPLMVK